MEVIIYRPQLKEVEAKTLKTTKNYINFLKAVNPEIVLVSKTDKKFVENLASVLTTEEAPLNITSEKEFIKSLFDNKIFVKTTRSKTAGGMTTKQQADLFKKPKKEVGIGGRKSIEKKVDIIKSNRKILETIDKQDEEMFKNMTNEQKKYWLKILSDRRDAKRKKG